jgi:ribosomal-protein-alanine N-acetyltransferase
VDQPTLTTARLILRHFVATDASVVQRLAGDARVAATTLHVPHPYLDGMAEAWIATHSAAWREGKVVTFAITSREGELRGAIALRMAFEHSRGELGYWIGHSYWGQGLATEAAGAVLEFAFRTLQLNRVQANYLPSNPASGRVLEKLGMQREGLHRERYRKGKQFQDVVECAILRRDWMGRHEVA